MRILTELMVSQQFTCTNVQLSNVTGETFYQVSNSTINIRSMIITCISLKKKNLLNCDMPGAIIGDGDRKSWDPHRPVIWDNISIFRTNCAILTSYIRAASRTFRGFSRVCCHVA